MNEAVKAISAVEAAEGEEGVDQSVTEAKKAIGALAELVTVSTSRRELSRAGDLMECVRSGKKDPMDAMSLNTRRGYYPAKKEAAALAKRMVLDAEYRERSGAEMKAALAFSPHIKIRGINS